MKVISIGEVLWDVLDDKEHLGGAALNFSADLARLGHTACFISAVGNDLRGAKILERMREMGLSTNYVRVDQHHSTGIATVTCDRDGHPVFALRRPAAYDFPVLPVGAMEELFAEPVDWIYFGTLHQMSQQARKVTLGLLERGAGVRRFYDINLRPDSWEAPLVKDLMSGATVVKLNDFEVESVSEMFGEVWNSLEQFCRCHAKRFGWEAVCVTRGEKGCALLIGDEYVEAPGYPVKVIDTVGAGDAFAAGFLHGLGSGWTAAKTADFANRMGALVASRPGAIPGWTMDDVYAIGPRSERQESA